MHFPMNNFTISGVMCGAFTLFCCTWALSSPQWLTADLDLGEVYVGLWKDCSSDYTTGHAKCGFKDTYPFWITATIFLEIAGLCLIFADVLFATEHMCIPRWNHAVRNGTGLYSITGGLIIAIGAIVWTVWYKKDHVLATCHLSAGFSLAILTVVMSIITGSFLLLGRREEPGEHSYTAL